jgi:hypothetical protein
VLPGNLPGRLVSFSHALAQWPLAPPWVVLSHRIIAYYGHIRASARLHAVYWIMSAWPCACAPAAEVPQFTLPILCDVPSSVLRWFQQVHVTISSLPMLSSQQLQRARQPRVPRHSRTIGVSSRSCNVRLMLRPARSACPALVRTFTSELPQVGSPPKPASDITSWLIVCYHDRIFPGRTGSLMGCNGVWTFFSPSLEEAPTSSPGLSREAGTTLGTPSVINPTPNGVASLPPPNDPQPRSRLMTF